MVKKTDKNIIVGLDIGTSKVVAIVGEVKQDDEIEIIGIGSHPSRGMKKGVVVNIEATVQSIQRAIEEAELMAGCQIHSVYAGIAGSHVRSLNSHGIVAIKDKEVYPQDLERVIDAAQAVANRGLDQLGSALELPYRIEFQVRKMDLVDLFVSQGREKELLSGRLLGAGVLSGHLYQGLPLLTDAEGTAMATPQPRRPASRESMVCCRGRESVSATSRPGSTGRSHTDSRPTMRPEALISSSLTPDRPRSRSSKAASTPCLPMASPMR